MPNSRDILDRWLAFRMVVICSIPLLFILWSDGSTYCGIRRRMGWIDGRIWSWIGAWNGILALLGLVLLVCLIVFWRYSKQSDGMSRACRLLLLCQTLIRLGWFTVYWLGLSSVPSYISASTLVAGAIPLPFIIASLLAQRPASRVAMAAAITGSLWLGLEWGHQVFHFAWCEKHIVLRIIFALSCAGLMGTFIVLHLAGFALRRIEQQDAYAPHPY